VHFQNPIAVLDNLVPRIVHSGDPEEGRAAAHTYDSWVGPHPLLEAHMGHGAGQESNFGFELCVWDSKRDVVDLHLGIDCGRLGLGRGLTASGGPWSTKAYLEVDLDTNHELVDGGALFSPSKTKALKIILNTN
jgi:hypothetical protein